MRRLPVMLLAFASLVPPLVACSREQPGPAVATATATATTPTTKSPALAASPGDAELGASPPTSTATASTAAAATEPPPPDPKNKVKCGPFADRVNWYIDANRACASAADCVEVHTTCGAMGACGTYVSRGKEAGLRKVSGEMEALNCFALGVVPCATCAPLPPPACVGGKCAPLR